MVNLSVWRSPSDLWNFVYLSQHLDLVRRRREWFERIEPTWRCGGVAVGTVPSVE
jgi:hypothetical protein